MGPLLRARSGEGDTGVKMRAVTNAGRGAAILGEGWGCRGWAVRQSRPYGHGKESLS